MIDKSLLKRFNRYCIINDLDVKSYDIFSSDANNWDELSSYLYQEYGLILEDQDLKTYYDQCIRRQSRSKPDDERKDADDKFARLFFPKKKKAKNDVKVYGFDIETTQDDMTMFNAKGKTIEYLQQDFYMGSIIGDDGYRKIFYDKEDMKEAILKLKGWVAAHNLEFDLPILFPDLSEFLVIYRNGVKGAIYKDDDRLRFTDTMNYKQGSLASLAELVGMKKLDMPSCLGRFPKNHREKRELETYNIKDSVVCHRFMDKLRLFCTLHNMTLGFTTGAIGMDYYQRNHQKKPWFREPMWLLDKHFLGSGRGGLVGVFRRGTYVGPLIYKDYRSHYPGRCRKGVDGEGTYPDPSHYLHVKSPTIEHIENYEGICKARIWAPYSYLPVLAHKHNRLMLPYGDFKGWYTNVELRYAIENGYRIYPEEMIMYKKTFEPFKDAVEYLYSLRKKYKIDGNSMEQFVKLILNAGLFGRWGFNYHKMDNILTMKDITFDEQGYAFYTQKDEKIYLDDYEVNELQDCFSGFVTHKMVGTPPRFSFPILSEYTMALARIKLLDDIRACKNYQDHLVYMDTDSCTMTKDLLPEGENLGEWELEYTGVGGTFIMAKFYHLDTGEDDIHKCKGVRSIDSHKDFIQMIKDRNIKQSRFTKLRESAKRKIRSGSIIEVSKNLNLEDTKRDWMGQKFSLDDWQNSRPLKLSL